MVLELEHFNLVVVCVLLARRFLLFLLAAGGFTQGLRLAAAGC